MTRGTTLDTPSINVTVNQVILGNLAVACAGLVHDLFERAHGLKERDYSAEQVMLTLGATLIVVRPLLTKDDQGILDGFLGDLSKESSDRALRIALGVRAGLRSHP